MADPARVQISQPGMGNEKYAQGQMMNMGVVTQQPAYGMGGPQAMAPGLEYLASLDRVHIHQIMHLSEVLLGWERNNKYQVMNDNSQQFLEVKEDTDCCTRQWLGTLRPFVIDISTMQGQTAIQLSRDCHCQGCCWPCCLQQMDIHFPVGNKVATIKELWTCLTPEYEVVDISGQCIFKIVGPKCYCKCCTDVNFRVMHADGTDAGEIVKHWRGCEEICAAVNDFSINFAPGETPTNKAILLGATFLVDFMYFERNKNN